MIEYQHLLGKQFEMGKQDCYALVREFYRDNFQIELPDYARPDRWWEAGLNLYYEHFEKEGFKPVDVPLTQLQVGDCLLMAFQCTFPNHCGIYIGRGKIIHHMYRQLSREDYLRGAYRNGLLAVARHKDVVIPDEPFEVLDLKNLKVER